MDIVSLIVKLLAFSAGFFLMMQYIFSCSVANQTGLLLFIIAIIVVILLFFIFKQHEFIKCTECNQNIPKKLFNNLKLN